MNLTNDLDLYDIGISPKRGWIFLERNLTFCKQEKNSDHINFILL